MTPAIWLAAMATLSLIVSAATFAYTWNTNRARASQQELDKLRANVDEVDRRVGRGIGELRDRTAFIEANVQHLPSTKATHELAIRIEEMHGDMKGLQEAIKGLQGQLETVNMHLLRESR